MNGKTSESKSNILTLAKQGNTQAIASILNYFFKEKRITTQASITNTSLKLVLESAQVPDKKILVPLVSQAINQLNIQSINSVKVVGQAIGANSPRWVQLIGVNNNQIQTEPETTESITPSQPDSQQQNTNTTNEQKKLDKLINLSQKSMWLTAIFGWTIPIATYIYTKRQVAFYIWFFVFGILLQGILSASLINFLLENSNSENIFIKGFYFPFLVVSLVSIIDNCLAIKRARKQVYSLTGKTPWTQKQQQKPKPNPKQKNKWPVWFPYPNSWLKTLVLLIWAIMIVRIFGFWSLNVGLILSKITANETFFITTIGLGLIVSILILSYFYYIFYRKQPFAGYPKWLPNPRSIWEGFYAPIVLLLSLLIVMMILFPFLPISNCNYQTLGEWGYCARMSETKLTKHDELIASIGLISWLTIAAYFYQIEYWLRKNTSLKDVGKFLLTISMIFCLNGHISILSQLLENINYATIASETQSTIKHELTPKHLVGDGDKTDEVESDYNDISEAINQKIPVEKIQTANYLDDGSKLENKHNFNPAQKSFKKVASQQTLKERFFQDGINEATTASFLVQKAKTKDEWEYISTVWEKAIEYMKAVQPSDPNYQAAQDRVIQYQKNLEYAVLAASRAQ